MNITVYDNYENMSKAAAGLVIEQIKKKPNSVITIPGGNTPIGMLDCLVESYNNGKVSFTNCFFVGLDEWVGLSQNDSGSCQQFLFEHFFNKIDIKKSQIHLFNAKSQELLNECSSMDQRIQLLGGIDLMILGIGMNGHLGFNEPETPFDIKSHVVNLNEITTKVGKKYFENSNVPNRGITLGIKTILDSKEILLLANGENKKEIIRKLQVEEPTIAMPATALKLHQAVNVFIDKECVTPNN